MMAEIHTTDEMTPEGTRLCGACAPTECAMYQNIHIPVIDITVATATAPAISIVDCIMTYFGGNRNVKSVVGENTSNTSANTDTNRQHGAHETHRTLQPTCAWLCYANRHTLDTSQGFGNIAAPSFHISVGYFCPSLLHTHTLHTRPRYAHRPPHSCLAGAVEQPGLCARTERTEEQPPNTHSLFVFNSKCRC